MVPGICLLWCVHYDDYVHDSLVPDLHSLRSPSGFWLWLHSHFLVLLPSFVLDFGIWFPISDFWLAATKRGKKKTCSNYHFYFKLLHFPYSVGTQHPFLVMGQCLNQKHWTLHRASHQWLFIWFSSTNTIPTSWSAKASYNNGKVQIIRYCVFWLLVSGNWSELQRHWVTSGVLRPCAQGPVKMNLGCMDGKPESGRPLPLLYGWGDLFIYRWDSSDEWDISVVRRATESALCIVFLSD